LTAVRSIDRPVRPGATPSSKVSDGAVSAIAARTASGVRRADTGSRRPTTAASPIRTPSSAVTMCSLGFRVTPAKGGNPVRRSVDGTGVRRP
jgi:hypothetical protein